MLSIRPVKEVWEEILPGIMEVWKGLPWKDWIPEDIYASCLSGHSVVLTHSDMDPQTAFGVVRMDTCGQTGRKNLFLWIAWCANEEGAEKVYRNLDEIASQNGCSSIDFITGSPELVKYGERFGYDKVMYEVRKEIVPLPIDTL